MSKISCCFLLLSLVFSFAAAVCGQWMNRYPKIANVSHHVYLEGYNLPTLNQGATRPPMADSYPFAHTAPIWFGRTGSFDPTVAKMSALDLLRWMSPKNVWIRFIQARR